MSEQQDPRLQDEDVAQVETLETKDGEEIDVKEEPESQSLENSGAEENETSPPPVEGTAFDASGHNETTEANVTDAQSKEEDPSNNTTEATGGKRYVMFVGSIHLNSYISNYQILEDCFSHFPPFLPAYTRK